LEWNKKNPAEFIGNVYPAAFCGRPPAGTGLCGSFDRYNGKTGILPEMIFFFRRFIVLQIQRRQLQHQNLPTGYHYPF